MKKASWMSLFISMLLLSMEWVILFGAQAPTLSISEPPAHGSVVEMGKPLRLVASTSAGLSCNAGSAKWVSSLQGVVASGGLTEERVMLAPGAHWLTVSCTSGGGVAQSNEALLLVSSPVQNLESYAAALGRLELLEQPKEASFDLSWYLQQIPKDAYIFAAGLDEAKDPTRLNTVVGNRQLVAGLTSSGDLNTLRYPSAAGLDHVDFLEHVNASLPNMGGAVGLRIREQEQSRVVWLRDQTLFTSSSGYLSDDDVVVVTEYQSSKALLGGVRVKQTAFVPPSSAVLVNRFSVTGSWPSSTTVELISYANLAPCTHKIPSLPLADWLLDIFNDFAVLVDTSSSSTDALLHFRPDQPSFYPILSFLLTNPPSNLSQSAVNGFAQTIDSIFGPGIFFALSCAGGCDSMATFPVTTADPSFESPSPATFGRGFSLLTKRIQAVASDASSDGTSNGTTATFYLAAGRSRAEALQTLDAARWSPNFQLLNETLAFWQKYVASLSLPVLGQPSGVSFAKRAMISIAIGTVHDALNNTAAAIVASVDSQTPYGFDWPRDGLFLNDALYAAGNPSDFELVTRHNLFYAAVQRTSESDPLFKGTYAMNYYPDGLPGGPVPLEIDEVGLAALNMARHVPRLSSASERARYTSLVWPAVEASMRFACVWTDNRTGLPLPANEDDTFALTQGIQGSIALWMALQEAISVGTAYNLSSAATLASWQQRFEQLGNAIQKSFYDPATGTWGIHGKGSSIRGASWFFWPAQFFPFASPQALQQALALWNATSPMFTGVPGFYGYQVESMLGIARVFVAHNDTHGLSQVRAALDIMLNQVATPARHLGEFYYATPGCTDSSSVGLCFLNSNDLPHLYEQSLLYLLSM